MVWEILCNVREKGDEVLLNYIFEFDYIILILEELKISGFELDVVY